MVELFEILQQILETSVNRETQLLDAVKSVCDANIKIYPDILDTSERLAYSSANSQHAQQGIEKMRLVKRQFEEVDDQDTAAADNDPESSWPFNELKYERTMEFVGQYKNTRKRMNWKGCHDLLLEKTDRIHYKNPESFRCIYIGTFPLLLRGKNLLYPENQRYNKNR